MKKVKVTGKSHIGRSTEAGFAFRRAKENRRIPLPGLKEKLDRAIEAKIGLGFEERVA